MGGFNGKIIQVPVWEEGCMEGSNNKANKVGFSCSAWWNQAVQFALAFLISVLQDAVEVDVDRVIFKGIKVATSEILHVGLCASCSGIYTLSSEVIRIDPAPHMWNKSTAVDFHTQFQTGNTYQIVKYTISIYMPMVRVLMEKVFKSPSEKKGA